MTITDTAQQVREALVAIVDGDSELQALFGRSSELIVPRGTREVGGPIPVLTYAAPRVYRHVTGFCAMDLEFSAFGDDDTVCGKAVTRVQYLFATSGVTWNAFAAHSLAVCPDPIAPPTQDRQGDAAEIDDDAASRADLQCTLLIPD